MDNQHFPHSEMVPPDWQAPHVEGRFKDDPRIDHVGIWTVEEHTETSVEKNVRLTLHRIHIIGGIAVAFCALWLIITGIVFYHRLTYVDPVKPDYSSLETKSKTYWSDRVLLDIAAAQQSPVTVQLRHQRLQKFAQQTMSEAMTLSSPYAKAQAVTSVATTLAQYDINITFDRALQQLGTTELIASMRARTLVSQALMHIRLKQTPSAINTIKEYHRLVTAVNLKLNSPLNEESFFGAVTVFRFLNDSEGLLELVHYQKNASAMMSAEQRMKAYRLIAGEQARLGMISSALQTADLITHPVELARSLALIIYYTARPLRMQPIEPVRLDIPFTASDEPLTYPLLTEETIVDILKYLADNKNIATQQYLLQWLAGSRLMYDRKIHAVFRDCILASEVLDKQIKQSAIQLLDNPESPTIRSALQMPPLAETSSKIDTALGDWTVSGEAVVFKTADVDPDLLRSRNEQQRIQALLAIVQGYQSVRRFQDAERILKLAFIAAQRISEPNFRIRLLMRIAEQQIAVGSIVDAQQTLSAAAPILDQNQKGELARLCVIARLFEDAQAAIATVESAQIREYACSFLLREQIRIHDISGMNKTLALMPQGQAADVCRCQLNITQAKGSRHDYETLGISSPEDSNQNWEQHCIELIRQGLLHTANQSAERIDDVQKRTDILSRIAEDYQLLYQSFNDTNDVHHPIRQSIQRTIMSIAERIGQPTKQTGIMVNFLTFFANQVQNNIGQAEGRQLLAQTFNICRRITKPAERAVLFAQLIVIQNNLCVPMSAKNIYPLFTKETNKIAFEDTNTLIEECLTLVNSSGNEEQQGYACVYLARALAQVGRISSAQTMHKRVLEIATRLSDRDKSISLLLAMTSTLKVMNSADTAPLIYRLAIDKVIQDFSVQSTNIDVYEWRMRDSEIEWIVRSQMENGYFDEALESAMRLNEPMLRDRLIRIAAYIYLDQGKVYRAELATQRLTVKRIKNEVHRHIQVLKNFPLNEIKN